MSDYIDRQDAINAIKTAEVNFTVRSDINFADYQKTVQEIFNNVLYAQEQVLKRLPSAHQWIPCSERLPEVGRCVLLSVGGLYTAEGCLRDDGDWSQYRWDAIQRKDMVGAWMPLPEPYKGGGL